MPYIHDIKFGMLQMRENEIPLRKGLAVMRSWTPHREHCLYLLPVKLVYYCSVWVEIE